MKFFNREKEIKEILSVIESEPQLIHFIYGPINSGKSALIREIIRNKLDKSKYIPFLIDFRQISVGSFEDFIEAMFDIDYSSKIDDIKKYVKDFINWMLENADAVSKLISMYAGVPLQIPAPVLKLEEKEERRIKNIYRYLKELFLEIRAKGKVPVFILDELQMLKDISLNGNRSLLKSFFQFLVALTKVEHLAHVFCVSSDSLFIEYVYSATELEGRAKYILVDDFKKKEALEFLSFLEKEILKKENFLSQGEKEKIYDLVGGKPVYLVSIISDLKTKPLNEVLSYLLQDEKQKIKYFLEDIEEKDIKLYKKVIDIFKLFQDKLEISDSLVKKSLKEFLVSKNILFLDPVKGVLKPQSRLTWHAINKALKELNLT